MSAPSIKAVCMAVINVFETGKVLGDYSKVTLIPGDTGHLTYGRSQTTLAGGGLYFLIDLYCRQENAVYGVDLQGYLPRLLARDLSLDHDEVFKQALKFAGADPTMRRVQDAFFDDFYWKPAHAIFTRNGWSLPLSMAVVYDSTVHGSFHRIASRVSLSISSEKDWVARYVMERLNWLSKHSRSDLRKTAYRPTFFLGQISSNRWNLELPMTVNGVLLSEDTLKDKVPVPVPARASSERVLRYVKDSLMSGPDVVELQEALRGLNQVHGIQTDGVFGLKTQDAVKKFQRMAYLKPDGIVGPRTRMALGLKGESE